MGRLRDSLYDPERPYTSLVRNDRSRGPEQIFLWSPSPLDMMLLDPLGRLSPQGPLSRVPQLMGSGLIVFSCFIGLDAIDPQVTLEMQSITSHVPGPPRYPT